MYYEYKEISETACEWFTETSINASAVEPAAASTAPIGIAGLIRKQRVIMNTVRRLIAGLASQQCDHPSQLWQKVESLNYTIWKLINNLEYHGYWEQEYIALEADVQEQLILLTTNEEFTQHQMQKKGWSFIHHRVAR